MARRLGDVATTYSSVMPTALEAPRTFGVLPRGCPHGPGRRFPQGYGAYPHLAAAVAEYPQPGHSDRGRDFDRRRGHSVVAWNQKYAEIIRHGRGPRRCRITARWTSC